MPRKKPWEPPTWWPDWMREPTKYPLGECKECGAQQYSMSSRENHLSTCSRAEDLQAPGKFRTVPWPKTYTG